MTKWQEYGKAFVNAVWAVVTIAIPLVAGDQHIDTVEAIIIVMAVGDAVIVYVVPLNQSFRSIKSVVSALIKAMTVASVLIGAGGWAGLQADDWYQIAAAFLLALGVLAAPAASMNQERPVRVHAGSDA